MIYNRKYATATVTATHVRMQLLKTASDAFAVGADWTPGAGDVKVSIDGGAQANITTLPTYTNGWWVFPLSIAELTGMVILVDLVNAAIQSDGFIVETFGNASALYPDDTSVAAPDLSTPLTDVQTDVDELQTTLGAAGAGLTAIGDARMAHLDANVSTLATAAMLTDVQTDVDELQATIGVAGAGLTNLGDARLATALSELSTILGDDAGIATLITQLTTARAEPVAVPAANATLGQKVDWLFALARNKRATTATTDVLRNDADAATIGTATLSDDGTTLIRAKYA